MTLLRRTPLDVNFLGEASSTPKPWNFAYCINGRFLTQATTGVQRYANEVVHRIDLELLKRGGKALMRVPRNARAPNYRAIEIETGRARAGYFWEQCELPARLSQPVLSLCNVGPLVAAEQILCIHDVNVFRCPDSYSARFRWLYRILSPLLARRAARLVTVSYASRRDLAEVFSLPEKDITVLPNGHEHALDWKPELSTLGATASFRPFVLLIGSPALHKNIGLVLGAADALDEKGIDIVVAGGDAPIFARHGKFRAPNVRLLGRVSDDDLAWLYGKALCLAFPSRCEGFGLPLLEAMTSGCPVVAAPISSSREVCGSVALYAGPDDARDWVEAFSRLAASKTMRAEMAEAGRIRARAFTWRRTARGYLELAARGHA